MNWGEIGVAGALIVIVLREVFGFIKSKNGNAGDSKIYSKCDEMTSGINKAVDLLASISKDMSENRADHRVLTEKLETISSALDRIERNS